ncbi:unnamed protein product [Thlaspi arvense]|uniref:Reverse transcriptase zinc-binding domain-containing protein n=1 Tax=Thlaspi arvense TaxID=13288 RepID=A0AAU9SUG6_THLAR|nr:unnamed protein product [Thlaspi arvense]
MGLHTRMNANLTIKDLLHQDTNSWNLEAIKTHLPQYEDTIRLLIPSSLKPPDSLVWLPAKSGNFTTKTRETNNALPVGLNLRWREINANACCTRCGEQETIAHIWCDCPYTKEVWRVAPITPNPKTLSTDIDSRDLLRTLYKSKNQPSSALQETPLYLWILWILWTSRNKLTFEGSSYSAPELVDKATQEAILWHSANIPPPPILSKPVHPKKLPYDPRLRSAAQMALG